MIHVEEDHRRLVAYHCRHRSHTSTREIGEGDGPAASVLRYAHVVASVGSSGDWAWEIDEGVIVATVSSTTFVTLERRCRGLGFFVSKR
jgi:hypothetical protein